MIKFIRECLGFCDSHVTFEATFTVIILEDKNWKIYTNLQTLPPSVLEESSVVMMTNCTTGENTVIKWEIND